MKVVAKVQYAAFFEGASTEDAKELARYVAEALKAPLGNRKENSDSIRERPHDRHHWWERKNNFTREGIPQLTKDGPFPSDFYNADFKLKFFLNF
mgnify:CR=1 FL=1